MFNLLESNETVQTMDKAMSLSSKRMSLIASNLANIDTPGYRTKDFSFEQTLKQALAPGGSGSLEQTHPLHFQASASDSFAPPTEPILPQSERNDGNDVSLDRETMLLARTQHNYQMGAVFMQNSIRTVLTAIREASR